MFLSRCKFSRLLMLYLISLGCCSVVNSQARAEGVWISVDPVDIVVTLPSQGDVPVYYGAYVYLEPDWTFESAYFCGAYRDDIALDVMYDRYHYNPYEPPSNPWFVVVIHPDTPLGDYGGYVTATAFNDVTSVTDTAYYTIHVVAAQDPTPPSAVPEPASALMLGLGALVAAGGFRRRLA